MRLPLHVLAWLIVWSPALFAVPPGTPQQLAPSPEQSRFVFSLLPRAFQSHPQLDLTGLTEMSEDGKKLPIPGAENPVYYQVRNAGFHTEGEASGGSARIDAARLEARLKQALEKAGYKPADNDHKPTQALFFIWGSHSTVSKGEGGGVPPNYWPNVLSRARLIGGAKFAADFEKALREQFESPMNMGIGNPLYRFTNRDDLTRELVEQIYDDCYYIVMSSYDLASALKGERKLLWRTKITTAANGVSLEEALPALVNSATNYFGRDLPTAEIRVKKLDRKGEVILGPTEVTEVLDANSLETVSPESTKEKAVPPAK